MNPIVDKVTEPTFTNSAKGLMTLFCIGLAHMVIGVELTDAKIAIPWLPTVNFSSPENLIYLYWGLVWYAMYRYVLEHATEFRKHWFNALASSLGMGRVGESFVRKSMFLGSDFYTVNTRKIESLEIHTVNIDTYSHVYAIDDVEYDSEIAYTFKFKFRDNYQFDSIECYENPAFTTSEAALHDEVLMNKWGLKAYASEGEITYQTSKALCFSYRMQLLWFKTSHYLKELLRNREVFDLSLPIIFNMCLFWVWVVTHYKIESLI